MSSDEDFMGYSDEEDDMMFEEEEPEEGPATNTGGGSAGQDEYRVIQEEHILTEQQQIVEEITEMFGVTDDISVALLRNFGWSKEVLIEKYYANTEKVVEDSGVKFALGRHNKTIPASPPSRKSRRLMFMLLAGAL